LRGAAAAAIEWMKNAETVRTRFFDPARITQHCH